MTQLTNDLLRTDEDLIRQCCHEGNQRGMELAEPATGRPLSCGSTCRRSPP